TSSTAFTTLLSKIVKVGGTTASCLVVTESASAFASTSSGGLEYWAATVDGTFCSPNNAGQGVQGTANDTTYAAQRSAEFICPGVSPGFHSVSWQWRSFSGSTVYAHWPTMRIEH